MGFLDKIHEIAFYGVMSLIICLTNGSVTVENLILSCFNIRDFITFFQAYMSWSFVLFLPISISNAFSTKYKYDGAGIGFFSDKILIIMFANIGREILGLILTPFWFLKDLFTKNLDNGWKVFDYFTYLLEILFVVFGLFTLL